ncbi:MAG: general stress protein CsbD [Rubricoccaceae bacterium]|nr:general stress protein CsbD [Rubricoccaceae bacterium]
MATERMNQNWRIIRDRIKGVWPEVDFEDRNMRKARGSLRQMVTLVHEHTGESRDEIRRKIMAVM